MRKLININNGWIFIKDTADIKRNDGVRVNLPHTWNASDGQDGGNDYFRGACVYKKTIYKKELPYMARCYIEIGASNSSAELYVNSEKIAEHNGGYSLWRADITDRLTEETELAIVVDNSPNDTVYPQVADFTFYGGLYRNVNLIFTNESHFELLRYGTPGIMITPIINENDAEVEILTEVRSLKARQTIVYTIYNKAGEVVALNTSKKASATLRIKDATLWHGRKNPYYYTAKAELFDGNEKLDEVSAKFGCRTFEIDPERGFILNGEEYPLRGVSRHQDRLGIGNALLPEHHEDDMKFIMEVGATTVRLAHYQHDEYFYDLCDRGGLVVWAEIPYISKHMPSARENTISQLKELIIQNYNHPSIVVWGLSNEITMNREDDPDLIENHRILNELAHELDKTRKTAIACVSMCSPDAEYIKIPDAISYNHYFGWYGGDTSMNGPWLDDFHKRFPDIPIGVSEYGCEGLNFHTSCPTQGDYTEEYQAYYHEELIKQLFTRKYLWATHVWNMFDFGADARCEGAEYGQNHKGLVTFDRGYKKDSYYAYKAWLSDEPFVHIAGKRYVDRVDDTARITVYSNQPEVELFANGKSLGIQRSDVHFFYFDVPNVKETELIAKAGELCDKSMIRKVDKPNEDYILKDGGMVLNWFEIDAPEGYFSLNDKLGDIARSPDGQKWLSAFMGRLRAQAEHNSGGNFAGFEMNEGMIQMMMGFTVIRMSGMLGMMNIEFTKSELLELNKNLNKIKKI